MTLKDAVSELIERNPRRLGETAHEWRERCETDTHGQRAEILSTASYERRLWWSMLVRGIISAYLVGLMLSLGRLNPVEWGSFAIICAASWLIAWIVSMALDR